MQVSLRDCLSKTCLMGASGSRGTSHTAGAQLVFWRAILHGLEPFVQERRTRPFGASFGKQPKPDRSRFLDQTWLRDDQAVSTSLQTALFCTDVRHLATNKTTPALKRFQSWRRFVTIFPISRLTASVSHLSLLYPIRQASRISFFTTSTAEHLAHSSLEFPSRNAGIICPMTRLLTSSSSPRSVVVNAQMSMIVFSSSEDASLICWSEMFICRLASGRAYGNTYSHTSCTVSCNKLRSPRICYELYG
jgi:hypothetical protein